MMISELNLEDTSLKSVKENYVTLKEAQKPINEILPNHKNIPTDYKKSDTANFFKTTYSIDLKPKPILKDQDPWVIPLLFFCLLVTGMVYSMFGREFKWVLTRFFHQGNFSKILNEENHLIKRTQNAIFVISILSISIFAYLLISPNNILQDTFIIHPFPLILIALGLFTAIKLFIVRFLGNLFSCKKEAAVHHTSIIQLYIYIGLILIPVSAGVKLSTNTISEIFIYIGIILLSFFYLSGLIAGMQSGANSSSISKFHLILYLCALEILPLIIFIKAATNFL